MDHARMTLPVEARSRYNARLQFTQSPRTDLIAWSTVKRKLDDADLHITRQGMPRTLVHCRLPTFWHRMLGMVNSVFHALIVFSYKCSISLCSRCAIKSRFNFPFAVSNPFSIENGSAWI